jgi:nicotinamidase-related amidase
VDTYLGHPLPRHLPTLVAPDTTALLIVDMQNDFLHPDGYFGRELGADALAGFRSATAPIARLAASARAAGVLVLYSRVVQLPDGSLASPAWLDDCLRYGLEPLQCMRDTWGYQVIDELVPEAGDVIIDKTRRSAFRGSPLQNILTARAIRTLVVTGVAASGCVEASVRDAIERDYLVVVPADAVANQTDELTGAAMGTFRALLGETRLTTVDALTAIWR